MISPDFAVASISVTHRIVVHRFMIGQEGTSGPITTNQRNFKNHKMGFMHFSMGHLKYLPCFFSIFTFFFLVTGSNFQFNDFLVCLSVISVIVKRMHLQQNFLQ